MAERTVVEPEKWQAFMIEFSERNKGRRARFELFRGGDLSEEEQEGSFESIKIERSTVTVERSYEHGGTQRTMTDTFTDIRGIAVQPDVDGSDNTLELTDSNGDMTVLHFESLVDGDS